MREGTCSGCAVAGPLQSYFCYEDRTYCRACTEQLLMREAAEAPAGKRPAPAIDATICARCQADNGTCDFSRVGELPFCQPCQDYLSTNPYPQWLKLGLVGLLMLLVIALMHGRKYFHAGREIYVGEKLIEQGKYRDAESRLQQTLDVAPESDKAVLLMARAALLAGDPNAAAKAIRGHDGGQDFEQDRDLREVNDLFARVDSALQEAKKASVMIDEPGKAEEAARLMHKAAADYPEMVELQDVLPYYDEGAAFERKDYDHFLAIAQQTFQARPNDADAAGRVASAMACKYAVSGDASWKRNAEEMLEKARQLSLKSPEAVKVFDEYAERTRYRLASREIIEKPEYDRRFRPGTASAH